MGSLSLTDSEWRNTSYGNTSSTVEAVKLPQAGGTRAIFGAIAALSVFLNFFFCVVMIRKPVMLKSARDILLFSLAITDLLTGNLMFVCVTMHSFFLKNGIVLIVEWSSNFLSFLLLMFIRDFNSSHSGIRCKHFILPNSKWLWLATFFAACLAVDISSLQWGESLFWKSRAWPWRDGFRSFDQWFTSFTSQEEKFFYTFWLFGCLPAFQRVTSSLNGNCWEINVFR